MEKTNANRILKNTLALYIRMFCLTIISLFTYRVVFHALGASDYGTYNVVGGFVSMFSFVSGTLTNASQRYFAVGLADDDWKAVNRFFSVNLVIYILLSVIVLLLAETVGLWFVTTRLNVDYTRMTEIVIVYEASVVNFLVGMLISPFLALLVASENLGIYSWISIVEGILKIVVAYVMYCFPGSKLGAYAIIQLLVTVGINGIYAVYCLRKYRKLRFTLYRDVEEYRSVFSFINWNMIGAIASVGKNQGLNIIINLFFGTVVNAARAVAFKLNTTIASFGQNFMKAIDPHIMKTYVGGDEDKISRVLYTSSKLSYFLLMIVAVPFSVNAEYVLTLWLGEIPEYTVIFTVLTLADALILNITDCMLSAVQATGKVKVYQLTVGTLALLNLPCSYAALVLTRNPVAPFIVATILDGLITVGRLVNFKLLHPFSIWRYCVHVLLRILVVTIVSVGSGIALFSGAESFLGLVCNVAGSLVVMGATILAVGLDGEERRMLLAFLPRKRRK